MQLSRRAGLVLLDYYYLSTSSSSGRLSLVAVAPALAPRRRADIASTTTRSAALRLLQIRMVEGHQCHRVAHAHRKALLGKTFKATSPNGRFADGAAAIDGKTLTRIECHGKNLFYKFETTTTSANKSGKSGGKKSGGDDDVTFVHIHFGAAGLGLG